MNNIAIISEFSKNTVNYGNYLQTYALNYYINNHMEDCYATSLYFNESIPWIITAPRKITIKKIIEYSFDKIRTAIEARKNMLHTELAERHLNFNRFTEHNIKMLDHASSLEELKESNFDSFIAGSDVVWIQNKRRLNPIRFLSFEGKKKFKKISYAASFGNDYIPTENISLVKQLLEDFDAISVREKSTIKMLSNIGVEGAVHCPDPTLLLKKSEWEIIAKKPQVLGSNPYIFVYLLGNKKIQRDMARSIAKLMDMPIVTVPYASGVSNKTDKNFGDIQIKDCAPEEWIWLVSHAHFVITDSFHGMIFSTIFEKRFFVIPREVGVGINNRMKDYLDFLGETDKFINDVSQDLLKNCIWDYKKISLKIRDFSKTGTMFLNGALSSML